jgi:glycosyltransferase involved in cell wall biosynthesis
VIRLLIVHASSSRRQGGSVTFLRNLLDRLNGDTFKITVLFLQAGGLADDLSREGLDIEVIETGRFRQVLRTGRAVAAIRRLIRRRGITLVFSNGAFEHLYAGTAAWLARVPATWYCHGCAEGVDLVAGAAARVPARGVVTHSEYTRTQLARRCATPIHVVHLGVAIPDVNDARPAIRRELGLDEACPLVAMVGVFMEWKGQDVFIRAAARIRETTAARFVLVGDAPFPRHQAYAASLKELAKASGLESAIAFLGFRNDAASIMAAADVVVHASLEPEPFGIVLLEAMAVERPVVTTGMGGAEEIVRASDAAIVVPPGNPDALAAACIELLRNPDRRRRLGAAGRETVGSEFSLGGMVSGLTSCLIGASQAG